METPAWRWGQRAHVLHDDMENASMSVFARAVNAAD